MRDVPRLIIEHNIHGIDIDPRAVQIAGLSLWLRAQRSWQEQGVRPAERPTIRRSNVVCAEPMPGDKAQLDAFLKTLRDERLESLIRRVLAVPENQRVRATPAMADTLCDLVRVVWEEMKLAGEAGALLKIEESLAAAIQAARDEWEQQPLFRVETFRLAEDGERETKPKVNYTRDVPGEAVDFWTWAETLVLAALAQYAEQATSDSYVRRLFAADAARGFAFIDVCRKRYDVALMNPPFGSPPKRVESAGKYLLDTPVNLYSAFVLMALERSILAGAIGAITDRTFVLLPSFLSYRDRLLKAGLVGMADLDWGVLDDAQVATCAYVLRNNMEESGFVHSWFIDARAQKNKETRIRDAITVTDIALASYDEFRKIPTAPLAYWSPPPLRRAYQLYGPLEDVFGIVRKGLSPGDSDRFVKLWWEVEQEQLGTNAGWAPYANGGSFSPYFRDPQEVVRWDMGGHEISGYCFPDGRPRYVIRSKDLYGSPGLTFGKRGEILNVQVLPSGCIFSNEGYLILPNSADLNWMLLAYLNSDFARYLVNMVCGLHKEVGAIKITPVPKRIFEECGERLARNAQTSFAAMFVLNADETEPRANFTYWMVAGSDGLLDLSHRRKRHLYELVSKANAAISQVNDDIRDALFPGIDLDIYSQKIGSAEDDSEIAARMLSLAMGQIYGRWSILFATGEENAPIPTDPFSSLPTCPPGMLQNAAGLPATPADVPSDYPLRISWPGILVNDPGHPEDIVGRVREALAVIWPTNHDAIEQEACQILGMHTLSDYFTDPNRFFDDHLKRYSKSRRQAPIYWPLSTLSGSYTLWIYYHRLTDQMLYTCVVDFVDPKLKQVSEDVTRLRQRASRSRDDERELTRLSDLERELKEFRTELLRLAPIWKPNLNDGVQITAAPLWKLFAHRAWQRTLRETWETLEAGDYDWAHLAMSLWPARVVPKCTTDRSLAIAHDVEDLFWVEDNGKWRALASPDQEIAAQRARHAARLSEKQRSRLLAALHDLAGGPGRGVAAVQVAQHLTEGAWDDTELALLCWPARVAEKCLDDPALANTLRLNLPPKRTKSAVTRWVRELADAGCPDLAEALLATLETEDAFDRVLAVLEAGRHDAARLALALWPVRVIDRCLENPELAAAHDLLRFFWVEERGGWRRRREQAVEVAQEIERRK